MLQRIQTLYLLIVEILFILMALLPIVRFWDNGWLDLNVMKLSNKEKVLPLTILIGLIMLINLITIVIFKKRILQIRLLTINILLMIGSIFFLGFYIYTILKAGDVKPYYQLPCIFPFLSIIFTILAISAIKKDEKLVRSIDRIR